VEIVTSLIAGAFALLAAYLGWRLSVAKKMATVTSEKRKEKEELYKKTEVSYFSHATSRITALNSGFRHGLSESWQSLSKPSFERGNGVSSRRDTPRAVGRSLCSLLAAWFDAHHPWCAPCGRTACVLFCSTQNGPGGAT